jgi:hypothetical protein
MEKLLSITLVMMTGLWLTGCGLTSGTKFIDQPVDERIESEAGSSLDNQVGHVVVDFTDNSAWQDYNIEGIEDGCIVLDAWNLLNTPVSGEVWITLDTTNTGAINNIADVQAAGGFRVFSGIALPAGSDTLDVNVDPPTKHFTCQETFALLENVDQLVAATQQGYFVAWGFGNEDVYHFVFDGIVFGVHVTGSL